MPAFDKALPDLKERNEVPERPMRGKDDAQRWPPARTRRTAGTQALTNATSLTTISPESNGRKCSGLALLRVANYVATP